MSIEYCHNTLRSRSRFQPDGGHRCYLPKGHEGQCDEFPFLHHLERIAPKVAKKIVRDAIMTTGASWKSDDAGPNRIRRWAMLKSDEELASLGIRMPDLSPVIVAKLRDKAASYDSCMSVAQKLTALVYGMKHAPAAPPDVRAYLAALFGSFAPNSTKCQICLQTLDYQLFDQARRGRAEIETAHLNPRLHTAENTGFAHRACNIAQGNKTITEFYEWIATILERAGYSIVRPS